MLGPEAGLGESTRASIVDPSMASPVLAIGLDGGAFDLIRHWARQGRLPTLSRLLAQGACAPLTLLDTYAAELAWTTFLTGRWTG